MQEKQVFTGNILIIVCCGFYLTWWLLAFRPSGVSDGMKTGWLLIPAVLAGLAGVFLTLRGMHADAQVKHLIPGGVVLWGGLAAFLILLAVTVLLFKRPVTTELFLIVGWCVLALSEINALFGSGLFSHRIAIGFLVLVFSATVISLVCYIVYYRLNDLAGYIVGMVPLLLAALVMAIFSCFIAILNK